MATITATTTASVADSGGSDQPPPRPAWLPPPIPRDISPPAKSTYERKAWWYRDRAARTWRRGPFSTQEHEDGSVTFHDRAISDLEASVDPALGVGAFGPYDPTGGAIDRFPNQRFLLSFGFRFDLTDAMMRRRGQDPYRPAKQRFLQRTFEARLVMATEARRRRLLRALESLPDELQKIWDDHDIAAAARRATIGALWCESDLEAPGHGTAAARQEARVIIESWVRRSVPATSGDAFTSEEQRVIGARCGAVFAPYRD